MNSVTGNIVGQDGYNGGWYGEYSATASRYAGYSNKPYVCLMKLDLPTLSGVINNIELTLKYSLNVTNANTTILRWALCTSDVNKDLYITNPPVDVVDEYQVASGLHNFSGNTTTLTIDAYGAASGQIYYLYLWGSAGAVGGSATTLTVYPVSDHTLTVYYDDGGRVYIDRGHVSYDESAGCSIIGQKWNSNTYAMNSYAYAGYVLNEFYTYALKFTTPNFVGTSKSVTFSIGAFSGVRDDGTSSEVSLRYALCSSDEEFDNYQNTSDMVIGHDQLRTGHVTFSGLSSSVSLQSLTVESENLLPNTTYYLILWGNNSGGYQTNNCSIDMASTHEATLESSVTKAVFDMYEVYIEDGENWYRYIPYIDNGTSWDAAY